MPPRIISWTETARSRIFGFGEAVREYAVTAMIRSGCDGPASDPGGMTFTVNLGSDGSCCPTAVVSSPTPAVYSRQMIAFVTAISRPSATVDDPRHRVADRVQDHDLFGHQSRLQELRLAVRVMHVQPLVHGDRVIGAEEH